MPHASTTTAVTLPAQATTRRRGLVPLVLAAISTLVLGGAAVSRAVSAPALDAHSDLQFSLDGATWADAPERVLGMWGCDVGSGAPGPGGSTSGIPGVDPCAMNPGEAIDRTYYVRNTTDSGRTGRYEVGVGDFVVSDNAQFAVGSTITGAWASDSGSVMLYGAGTGWGGDSPARGAAVAALDLAPGETARVVDEVSVPRDVTGLAQRQSVSPRIWVSFSDIADADRDGDGLPDTVEAELGTDPDDPLNRLPSATTGRTYGPVAVLPTPPAGAVLSVDPATLPPGMRISEGALNGTPSRAGTYDLGLTVTMPGGATYSSVRRVVVDPAPGGGSTELPDLAWPILVGGLIGVVVGIAGPDLGSLAGSLDGALTGSTAGSATGSTAATGSASATGVPAKATPSVPGRPRPGGQDDAADAVTGADTGRVDGRALTHREGAPSDEWIRANSEVRGPLATTGVEAAELVLWAVTAAAAGVTLILFARRRRSGHDEGDTSPDHFG